MPTNKHNVPLGDRNVHDNPRVVQIGSRFIGGVVGSYVGSILSVLGGDLDFSGKAPPDPTYHWSVIVGDFFHQLQADSDETIYYDSERRGQYDNWKIWDIGHTTFNDVAIQEAGGCIGSKSSTGYSRSVYAGDEVIGAMPSSYNFLDNNCQNFVYNLLDRIAPGHDKITGFGIGAIINTEDGNKTPKPMSERGKSVMDQHTPNLTPEVANKITKGEDLPIPEGYEKLGEGSGQNA